MLASHHQLSNLCCIIDYNHSNDRSLEISPLDKKLNSFGWEVNEINGHSHKEILNVFSKKLSNKPRAIIANTIKGQGVSFMENNPAWHRKFPNEEEYKLIMKELT